MTAAIIPAGWKPLNDVQWMNIVNHDRAYDQWSKEDAVHQAVKMTEAKLKEINAAPAIPLPAAPVQGWISVKDRLPELRDDSVLAYFGNGGIDMVHIQDYVADITAGVDSKGRQCYAKWYVNADITHWMPLPPPPVGDSNG